MKMNKIPKNTFSITDSVNANNNAKTNTNVDDVVNVTVQTWHALSVQSEQFEQSKHYLVRLLYICDFGISICFFN